jgi:peptidoglycan/LPS O-acetylase OafA/YrhL
MEPKAITRRYDIDWLRVLAILAVFIFHSTRFFNLGDWHVKNPGTYSAVQVWIVFASSWMMPFVFVISGASLFYATGKGGVGQFIRDKVLRLLVPLVVGVFTHAALQVYLERITHGQFKGSFFNFLPHYFEGIYGMGGNFAIHGMHLWYLLVLFVFSIVLLPLFLLLKTKIGSRVLARLMDLVSLPGLVYVLALAILLSWKSIDRHSLLGFDNFDWNLGVYLSFFLFGFAIMASEKVQQSIQRLRWISLLGAIALTVNLISGNPDTHRDLIPWTFILTFLGFGTKHLNFNTPFLKYANEAVLPFYILHQTVLLSVGYFVVQWAVPDLVKWLSIASISFVIIMGLYELVRRNNILRFLFGMKPLRRAELLKQSAPVATLPAQALPEKP